MSSQRAALAALTLVATLPLALAGCETIPDGEAVPAQDRAGDPIGAILADIPAPLPPVIVPGPPPESFVGRPVGALDALLGEPALIRAEGTNEFRRYDVTDDCRAYAVVVPAAGNVTSLTTGPAVRGAPVPRFEDCTAKEVVAPITGS